MIDLSKEKECKMTAQQRYDVISFAVDAANDNGFMNSFIFERALYLFAAIILYPERKEEISHIISEGKINDAWNALLEDGTINQMYEDFSNELDLIAEEGAVWYEEYTDYAHSARGILEQVQAFSGDIVKAAAEQLQRSSQASGVQEVLEIADKWGMNNAIDTSTSAAQQLSEDSLFEE